MARQVDALITPEVLKWARERRVELSIERAAEKLKISTVQLESWENGTARPSFAKLKDIAKLYRTHVTIFYLPRPPADFQPLTDYRLLPESLVRDEDQTYRLNANIVEAYERRETLIELYELLEEPPPQITLATREDQEPETVASNIREFLGFNSELLKQAKDAHAALKFWRHTVEAKGVLVCQTSVNNHLSISLNTARGFCIARKPLPVIVLNPKDSAYGRIFTLIHELVHIALGKSVIQNTGFRGISHLDLNRTEVFCNQVAAEVLVPASELLEIVQLQALEENVPDLSKYFHVSSEVIMRRLLTLGKVSLLAYQKYREQRQEKHKGDPTQSGGFAPYHNRLLNAAGEHFARTAFTAYYEQKITLAKLAAVLSNSNTKHLSKIESAIFK